MTLITKRISLATGIVAWKIAEKQGNSSYPCYFRWNKKLVAHYKDVYCTGIYGELGFNNHAAYLANNARGVYQESELT